MGITPMAEGLGPARRWAVAGMAIAIAWSLYQSGLGRQPIVNWGGMPQFGQFFRAGLRPDISGEFLALMGRAAGVTFAYAVCGTVLSLGLGFVGGVLSSEVWWRTLWPRRPWAGRPLWVTVRAVLAVPRAIHELIWGLIFINLLGLDPLVAVLAIAVPFGAIVAKVFSEILDETPPEPLTALGMAGVPPIQALLYGLLPQALPNLLSYSFYRFECSLRSSAVLGLIGAGGLGYEMLLSLQSLRYEQLWTAFYTLIVLNGAVDTWSALVRRRLGFTSRLALNLRKGQAIAPAAGESAEHPNAAIAPAPAEFSVALPWGWLSAGLHRGLLPLSAFGVAIAIPLCFWSLRLDWGQLWTAQTFQRLTEMGRMGQPPALTLEQVSTLAALASQTVAMSILAIALAGVGGIVFSFPAAQTFLMPGGVLRPVATSSGGAWVAAIALVATRLVLLISRAVPAPIWALVFLYILFPGLVPGAIALAIHNFGILGRLMAEANENLDDRPVRALRSLGASSAGVVLYGLLPQNLGGFMAYTLYRWEVCLRETVIVGLVGAGGLGRLMTEQLSSFDYAGLALTLGVFVGLTLGVDLISAGLRRALRS